MTETRPFPKSILITDDHNVIRRTLREWLCEEFPELSILEASSGEDALEVLATHPRPDLVVLDFHLPGINGIEVTREVHLRYPGLPVVILTIQEEKVYQDRAVEAGAAGYVIKRRMYNDLIPTIQRIMNGSPNRN